MKTVYSLFLLASLASASFSLMAADTPPPVPPAVKPTAVPTAAGGATATAAALSAVEEDWLYQLGDQDPMKVLVAEIAATRKMAQQILQIRPNEVVSKEVSVLGRLEQQAAVAGTDPMRLYLDVRRAKRQIMLRHPAIDFKQILLIESKYNSDGHQSAHRLGRNNQQHGGRLLVLEGLDSEVKVRSLAPAEGEEAAFWRPDLSFDTQRVLFCMKLKTEKTFHLYEIDLNGGNRKQLTRSNDYDDTDPIYLPDGRIMFCTTRGNTYVRCGPQFPSSVLARCDADGKNMYIISRNSENDWLPALLPDGRVIYSRWEYTDKNIFDLQGLWTINQDGTGEQVYYGNQTIRPNTFAMVQPIPGTTKVMFSGVGHHDWFQGSVGVVDPNAGGFNEPRGLYSVTRDVQWGESGGLATPYSPEYRAMGKFASYHTPFPISQELFLVSARRAAKQQWTIPFDLYLMDIHGNRELLWRGKEHLWHAMPVRPRSFPKLPDQVAWPVLGKNQPALKPGILFSADVYEGVPGLPRGTVKHLRVIEQHYKTYSTMRQDGFYGGTQGPVISGVSVDSIKRILGTVPVTADGSVCFEVPPGKALYFQLLDERGMAVHTMRSFTGAMPGEIRGCTGCHDRTSYVPSIGTKAMRQPDRITPPPWADATIGYERFVQPVLNKYCGKCHQGEGKGREKLDLTLRVWPETEKTQGNRRHFKEPYPTLVFPKNVEKGGLGLTGNLMTTAAKYGDRTVPPYTCFSPRSRLIEIATSGKHHEVKVTGIDLAQLIAWEDCNTVYNGLEEISQMPDPSDPGWTPRPRVKTAPDINRFNIEQDTK